jgi:hypothetical protein
VFPAVSGALHLRPQRPPARRPPAPPASPEQGVGPAGPPALTAQPAQALECPSGAASAGGRRAAEGPGAGGATLVLSLDGRPAAEWCGTAAGRLCVARVVYCSPRWRIAGVVGPGPGPDLVSVAGRRVNVVLSLALVEDGGDAGEGCAGLAPSENGPGGCDNAGASPAGPGGGGRVRQQGRAGGGGDSAGDGDAAGGRALEPVVSWARWETAGARVDGAGAGPARSESGPGGCEHAGAGAGLARALDGREGRGDVGAWSGVLGQPRLGEGPPGREAAAGGAEGRGADAAAAATTGWSVAALRVPAGRARAVPAGLSREATQEAGRGAFGAAAAWERVHGAGGPAGAGSGPREAAAGKTGGDDAAAARGLPRADGEQADDDRLVVVWRWLPDGAPGPDPVGPARRDGPQPGEAQDTREAAEEDVDGGGARDRRGAEDGVLHVALPAGDFPWAGAWARAHVTGPGDGAGVEGAEGVEGVGEVLGGGAGAEGVEGVFVRLEGGAKAGGEGVQDAGALGAGALGVGALGAGAVVPAAGAGVATATRPSRTDAGPTYAAREIVGVTAGGSALSMSARGGSALSSVRVQVLVDCRCL